MALWGFRERSDGGFCGGAISTADDDVGFTVCGTGEGLSCGLAYSGGAAYEESCWGGEKAALDARVDESEGIVGGIGWLGKGYRTSYWLRVAMTAFVMTCQCHRKQTWSWDQETRPQKEIITVCHPSVMLCFRHNQLTTLCTGNFPRACSLRHHLAIINVPHRIKAASFSSMNHDLISWPF